MSKHSDLAFASHAYGPGGDSWGQGGLTKRELFAAMAMQGFIANDRFDFTTREIRLVSEAVKCADALLAELAKAEGA